MQGRSGTGKAVCIISASYIEAVFFLMRDVSSSQDLHCLVKMLQMSWEAWRKSERVFGTDLMTPPAVLPHPKGGKPGRSLIFATLRRTVLAFEQTLHTRIKTSVSDLGSAGAGFASELPRSNSILNFSCKILGNISTQ